MDHIDINTEFWNQLKDIDKDNILKAVEISEKGLTDRLLFESLQKISDRALKFLGCNGGSQTVNFIDSLADSIYCK